MLRGQLARWPTGVAVITSADSAGPLGKTVNSFHATSLTPALVGWCIDHGSSQLDRWLAVDGYVVHVMPEDRMDLVSRFATSSADRFAGLAWVPGLDDMPLLPDEVPLRLECRIAHRMPVGDHTYLIGKVVRMAAADGVPMTLQR